MILEIRRYLTQMFIGWAISTNPNENETDRMLTVGLTATLLNASLGSQLLARD